MTKEEADNKLKEMMDIYKRVGYPLMNDQCTDRCINFQEGEIGQNYDGDYIITQKPMCVYFDRIIYKGEVH